MNSDSPIGVFDSGLGGLTVARQVIAKLPQESIIFIGDEIHVPYGERTPHEIMSFALGMCEFFIKRNSPLILMGCNMSSAIALSAAREMFPSTPIIGVIEAGVRAMMRTPPSGPIGVLATRGTVNTKAYSKTIQRFMPGAEVYEQACPLFVPLVEEGLWDTPEAEAVVREYADPLYKRGCRTFILGCTHYPFLTGTIRKVVGESVTLIDPSEETATEAARILIETGKASTEHTKPVHTYFTSADTERFAELGGRFLGSEISVDRITWGVDLRIIKCHEKTADKTMKSVR